MKIGILGGSGVYTPAFIQNLIKFASNTTVQKIVLTGRTEIKLKRVGSICQKLIQKAGLNIDIKISTNRLDAIKEMDMIISQIRVGGMKARAFDEKFPVEYGIIGEETVGPGGLSNAYRTIPVMLEIAREIEMYSPKARFIILTNPCSMVIRAILKETKINAIGICDLPASLKEKVARVLGRKNEELFVEYMGLNHLGWITKVFLKGEDVTQRVLDNIEGLNLDINPNLIRQQRLIPIPYLKYYYHTDKILSDSTIDRSRGDELMELEEELIEMYSKPDGKRDWALLNKRSTAWYGELAKLICSISSEDYNIHILNFKNNGIIPFLSDESVVEVPAAVNSSGIHPLKVSGNIPPSVRALLAPVDSYEELAVKGIIQNDRMYLIEALLCHPFFTSYDLTERIVERIVKENKKYREQLRGEDE